MIYMYYTSNERVYFSLSIDVSNFENKYGGRKWYLKRSFLLLLFLIVHISTNIVLDVCTDVALKAVTKKKKKKIQQISYTIVGCL